MTGKIKKSDWLDFTIEFACFSGTENAVLTFLDTGLIYILPRENVKMILVNKGEVKSRHQTIYDWLASTDQCIQLFNSADIPDRIRESLSVSEEFRFAVPVRKTVLERETVALIFVNTGDEEILQKIQMLALHAGAKIDFCEINAKMNHLIKYYNYGRISYDIFHEMKNKLVAPLTFLQTFPYKYQDEKFRNEFSALALDELSIVKKQMEEIMQYGKLEKTENQTSSAFLLESLNYCISLLHSELNKYKIEVLKEIDEKMTFPMSAQHLRDLLFNLLLNSMQALKKQQNIRSIQIASFSKKDSYGFSVRDTGCGITKENLSKLFKPFYTNKEEGTGLGLTIIKKFMDEAGGLVDVKSKAGEWTEFSFCFKTSLKTSG